MAPQHSIMPEWVHAIGFGNILWVLFLGRFLIPWDALGLGAESDAAVRYGFLWQASTFTIAAAVIYFIFKESNLPIGATVREWANGGTEDLDAAAAAAAAAEEDDGEHPLMKRMRTDPVFEKKVMKKAKAAGGDAKVMLDLGWKVTQESKDPDAKDVGLAIFELAKVEGKRRGRKRAAKKG